MQWVPLNTTSLASEDPGQYQVSCAEKQEENTFVHKIIGLIFVLNPSGITWSRPVKNTRAEGI